MTKANYLIINKLSTTLLANSQETFVAVESSVWAGRGI